MTKKWYCKGVKILYIVTKSNWGGAQKHVFDLASASKKNGQEVVVALGGEGVLRDRLREAGITTRSIGTLGRDVSVSGDSSSLMNIIKIIREIKPDILHLHSPKAAGLGAFAGRILGVKKVIYTVHGWAFNEDRPYIQKIAIAFFSWLTMLLSTHVITLSEKELGQAQAFPLVSHKLRMVRLGIHSPMFFATSSAQHFFQTKTTEPLSKRFVIGTIAELHPNKGLIYAINAFEKLAAVNPNFIFFIIGEGEQRAQLEDLIKLKKLEQNIKLLGYVPNAAEYLRGLSLFLLPSVKEGMPYVLIEAGYAGIPVIATTVGGIPELIDDMKTGVLVQPKKSDEIFHALEFLIEHKGTQREYARNFQERVKMMFNIEQMLQGTFKIYAEPKRR
jgi:glycosyltransferase involved in cell wall biosynthesis